MMQQNTLTKNQEEKLKMKYLLSIFFYLFISGCNPIQKHEYKIISVDTVPGTVWGKTVTTTVEETDSHERYILVGVYGKPGDKFYSTSLGY